MELKLLRAENAFYRACAAVRQSGVELQQVRGYLLQELLAVEVEKRERLDREAAETIEELQVCKQDYQKELSRLRNQLQVREDNSPESAAGCGHEGEMKGVQGKREGEREAVKLGEDGLAGSEAGSMPEMKERCSDDISQVEEVGSGADTQNGVDVGEGQWSSAVITKPRQKYGKGTRRNVESKFQSEELQLEHTCSQISEMDSEELGGKRPRLLGEVREGDRMAVNELQVSSTEVPVSKYHLNGAREESVLGGSEQVEEPLSGRIGPSQQDGGPVLGGSEENKRKSDGEPLSGERKQNQHNRESILGGNRQSQQDGELVSGEGGQGWQDRGSSSGGDGLNQERYIREKPVLGGGGQDNSQSVTSVEQGGEAVSGECPQDGNVDVTCTEQPQTATGELDRIEPCLSPIKTKKQQIFLSRAREDNSTGDEREGGAMQGKREGEREAVKLGGDGFAGSEAGSMPEMKERCSDGISQVEEVGSGADTQNGVDVGEGQQSSAVKKKRRKKYGRRSKGSGRNVRRTPVLSKSQSEELQLEHTTSQISEMDSEELGDKRPRLLGEVREGDRMTVNELQDSSTEVPVSKYHLNGAREESVLGGSEQVEEPLSGRIGQSRQDGGPTSGEDELSQQGCIREKPVLGGCGQDNGHDVTSVVQGGEAVSGECRQDGNVDVTFAKQPQTATGELDKHEPCLLSATTKKQTAKKRTARRARSPSKKKCGLSTHGSDLAQPAAQPQTEEGISRGREASPEIPLQNRTDESVPPVNGPFLTDRLRGKARLLASHDTTLLPATKRRKTLPCKRAKDSSQLSIVDTKATPKRRTTVRVNTRGFIAPKLKSLKTNF